VHLLTIVSRKVTEIMSLFSNYIGNAVCEKMEESRGKIGRFPRIWYHFFLQTRDVLGGHNIYTSKKNAKELLKYAIGKRTKISLYSMLRDSSMEGMPSSKIVRDIIGVCMFVCGIAEYVKVSVQLWRLKRCH